MIIINVTAHTHSKNVVEVTFHAVNNDWFSALFSTDSVDIALMKLYYVGKNFYEVKEKYVNKIFVES